MQFLVDNDLAVPSTFPHIHKGQTGKPPLGPMPLASKAERIILPSRPR
jgi:hypothetical protein